MTIDEASRQTVPAWELSARRADGFVPSESRQPVPTGRRLYRPGSTPVNLCQLLDEPAIASGQKDDDKKASNEVRPTSGFHQRAMKSSRPGSRRSRVSSVRSRKASRVEYHENLKPSLRHGLTRNLLLMGFVILVGTSFQFGYNIAVLNQPEQLIKHFYNTTYTERFGNLPDFTLTTLWAVTTTIFFLPGGMIGAFVVGYMADSFGRKRAVQLSAIPALLGAVLSAASMKTKLPELLITGRLFTGINCGMATQLAPLFLAEIAPFNLRGAFGTANQLFITIGIFVSNLLGLKEIFGTSNQWPFLLLFNAGPTVFCLLFLPCLPDSPRYLLINCKKRSKANKALKFLRQSSNVVADTEEMETECDASDGGKISYTLTKLLGTRQLWTPLFITVMLQIAQQLSGINAVFFYSTGIFKNAGVPNHGIPYAVLATSVVNVLMTVIALPAMDKAGRRPLLLYPMLAMIVILAIITTALKYQVLFAWLNYVSVVCFISYVICFAIGLGPIPMMITTELFRQGPRPRAMSIAGATNWLFTAVVALCFPLLQDAIKELTFVVFLCLMIVFTVFVYVKVPETKHKTFEEIASQFQPGDNIDVDEVEVISEDDDVFHPQEEKSTDERKKNLSLYPSGSSCPELSVGEEGTVRCLEEVTVEKFFGDTNGANSERIQRASEVQHSEPDSSGLPDGLSTRL